MDATTAPAADQATAEKTADTAAQAQTAGGTTLHQIEEKALDFVKHLAALAEAEGHELLTEAHEMALAIRAKLAAWTSSAKTEA